MVNSRRVVSLALLVMAATAGHACLASGYRKVKVEAVSTLAGDFAELANWDVRGEHVIFGEHWGPELAAKKALTLSYQHTLPTSYAVTGWVKFAPTERAKGEISLSCEGYELKLQHTRGVVHITTLANGYNVWGDATYKYREGRAPRSLRYHLKLDPEHLKKKLMGMRKALDGRTKEWETWGLGIRGEFMEERFLLGIEKLLGESNIQPAPNERWTQLAMDVAPDVVRMWVDGRLVAEAKDPLRSSGGIILRMPAQARLRSLEVKGQPDSADEFLTLYLAGHHNRSEEPLESLPQGLIRVKRIPFLISRGGHRHNCIDVGRSRPMESGFAKGFMGSPFNAASGLLRNPVRPVLLIPKGWYSHLYLLAFAERELDAEPVVSFRFFRSERTGTIIDYSCQVPYRDERARGKVVASVKLDTPKGPTSWLHVVEVALEPCLMQSYVEKGYFRSFQIEITKGLRFTRGYPDPWNYVSVPGGKTSCVRIAGLTFRRSPLEMVVTTDEVGHIVVEPERPYVNVLLRNRSDRAERITLDIRADDTYGQSKKVQLELEVPEACSLTKRCLLPLEKYGFYKLTVTAQNKNLNLVKKTTLGYLPPDTRRAGWGDSAFGIWGWGAGVGNYAYPVDSEETMRLIWKLGGRWTLNPPDPKIAKKYGITNAWSFLLHRFDFDKIPPEKWEEELKKAMLANLKSSRETFPDQDIFLLFGEANLGIKHTYGLPGRYYGEPDCELDEKGKAKFERYFRKASLYGKVLKQIREEHKEFRHVKIAFGNTSPSFHIEFLKNGFPAEYIDIFGIDIPYFERMPERQPRSVEASQLLILHDYQKEAKCEQIPICGTEDMYYPGCPGSLSQREQADYFVRCHLLKFAMGVTREVSVGMVFTTSGPYGRGHYGATGLFEVSPEGGGDGNPRESAVAYATMTRVLDAAKFEKWFPTGSLTTYCLAFSRKFTKDEVLALWTIHGTRPVSIHLDGDAPVQVTDQWGNTHAALARNDVIQVDVTSSPIYVIGLKTGQIKEVKVGAPIHSCKPAEGYALLEDFDSTWSAVAERDTGYEENCFDLPKFKGEMTASLAKSFDGGKAFRIVLEKPKKERKLAPWYTAYVPPKPIPMPGGPTKIGLWAKGNSGWGRIIPQLTDAKGEIWTFIGPKDAWNADDIRSQSSINFDGWKYMEMELPNTLPNLWPGPALAFWKNEKGDRVVDYPLSLTKLFIEQYTHTYYVNTILPVPAPKLTIDKIVCTYDDPYRDWHLMKGW